ncbi:MAG: hypothetical protein DCF15_09985, partial [Phormidesmis priestleyi]
MLANVLSILLGLGSVTFYLAGFFYPESHRRSDVVWSGLGTLYALVLWFWAEQITGIVLLAQVAVLALLLGLGWQLLTVRREKTPVYQQTPVVITPEIVADWTKNQLNQLRIAPAEPIPLRLEKRNLSDSLGRLRHRPDPRRRPVYDYEFVEDGILETMPAEPVLEEVLVDLDTTVDDSAPTFADAKILSVERLGAIAQTDPPKPDIPTVKALEIEALEVEPPKIEPSEIRPIAVEPPEIEPFEIESPEIELPEVEPPETQPSEVEPPEVEPSKIEPPEIEPPEIEPPEIEPPEFEPSKAEVSTKTVPLTQASSQSTVPSKRQQKTNLLAAPLILIGWFK